MVLFRKLHKWIGLVIGLQVAVWMLSGLSMGLLDQDRVEGTHNSSKTAPVLLQGPAISGNLIEPGAILGRLPIETVVHGVQLRALLDQPVYRVKAGKATTLYNARDGSRVVIDEPTARALALEDFSGVGRILAMTEIAAPSMEVRRHSGPVWRVDFDDEEETSLYVSGQDGAILERRNASWRLFDLFWMLHIMDYQGREDFNNSLAIFASLVAAWFSITGVVLFFGSFTPNDFLALVPGGALLKHAELTVCAPHGEVVARISATAGARLYDELAKGEIVLPSSCGGGGTCGLCVVNLEPSSAVSAADKALLSKQQRRRGLRLSCQARAVNNLVVGVSDDVLAAERRSIEVVSTRLVTPHILEINFNVAGGELNYAAGAFVHVLIPPHEILYDEIAFRDSIGDIWAGVRLATGHRVKAETSRAYSLATAPEDNPGQITLNVRFMPPPAGSMDVDAGIGSSYMWNLRPGDQLDIIGPLGDFRARDSGGDKIIIGGGAGMAPLRSILRQELLYKKSSSNIQFWYGARSQRGLFYVEELNELQDGFANFSWHAVLSEPEKSDDWGGATGFVHLAVQESFLRQTRCPENFEYYVCGPPQMLVATRKMLADVGVPESQVLFDDFGI